VVNVSLDKVRAKSVFRALAVMGTVAVLAAACSSSSKNSSGSTATSAPSGSAAGSSGSGNKASITVAMLNETSGEFASQFSPNVPGVQAWVDYENANGGIDGHHINLKVYDNQSNPTSAVANAHQAVESGAVAIIDTDPLFDSYATYLASQQEPVFGWGITPGFYGTNKSNFFSFIGNLTTGASDTATKFFLQNGNRSKWAELSDPSPADSLDIKAVAAALPSQGGQLVYSNYSIDPSNSASLLSVAQAVKNSGAQIVQIASTGSSEPQLQADLAQVGASNIWVVSGSDYAANLPQQFGSGLNNYTFESFTAPPFDSAQGVQTYVTAMKQYQPNADYNVFNSLVGWSGASLLGATVDNLHGAAVTKSSLVSSGNSLQSVTDNGLWAPVSYPTERTEPVKCLSFSQVQNGKWVLISGTASNPFFCG
jgi:branched-chain amino acid transport system substrate-binding protein